METLKTFLLVVVLSAFVFAGCSDDDKDLIADQEKEISGLTENLRNLQADYNELKRAKEDLEKINKGLEDEKEQLVKDKQELEQKKTELESEKGRLEGENQNLNSQINGFENQIEDINSKITGIEASINELENYKSKLEKLLGEASEEGYTGLVEKVLDGLKILGDLQALCGSAVDYEGSSTIKEYIDKAMEGLTSSLGNGVLKSEFDDFKNKYTEFKTKIESAGYVTTKEVEALFTKETESFKQGVLDIVTEATIDQEELSEALQQAIKELGDNYASKVDDLITRVEKLEAQVAGLLGRIQSLVYVPKTADGKIHIGTSYISAVDESGAETGNKIELSSTKKLEYRVSPAELRDYLLEYEEEVTFSFYQAHVSREGTVAISAPQGLRVRQSSVVATRAETREGHDGLNEFNVVKIEAGNDAGTLLITVDNEHDFTHEDLAVALCIRQNNTNTGVLTEFTSPYTTVIGEGTNLTDRFYVAKSEEDGTYSKVSRTDRIDYTLIYDDVTPVEFMKGYEVVYDNGETVMSLAEAKEKYEWDDELTGEIKRTGRTYLGSWTTSSDYVITPQNYQRNTTDPLTFQLSQSAISSDNVGKNWSCGYKASISAGGKSVDILSDVKAYVTVMPAEYVVDAHIIWNSGKWYNGKSKGWHSDEAAYTSDRVTLKYKKDNTLADESNLPPRIRREIFGDGRPWKIDGDLPRDLNVENNLDVNVATNIQDLAFTVKGYKYSAGEKVVKIKREGAGDGIPTSGIKKITVTGQLTFEGPTETDLNIKIGTADKPVVMATDPKKYEGWGNGTAYALMYLQLSPILIPQDKTVPVTGKFFTGGTPFFYATIGDDIEKVKCTKSSGDGPETLDLEYYSKVGGRPSPLLHSVNVKSNDQLKNIKSETTYTFDTGFDILLPDGPTIKVTGGTFKFVPTEN